MRFLLTICFVFFFAWVYSQSPVANFSAPSTACLQQNIALYNTSTNATSYEWDFCPRDSRNLIDNSLLASLPGLSGGYGYRLVEDNGIWYGFAISQTNHSLYRLEYGDDPTNTPDVINLGNPQNQLSFPTALEVTKAEGNWHVFVTGYDNNYGVVNIEFGTSLENTPTATNMGMFGINGRFWGIKIVSQASDIIMILPNRNGNSIARINFRDSFTNSVVGFVTENVITGADFPSSIDVVNTSLGWIALMASYNSNVIQQINFGNDLLGPFTVDGSFIFGGVDHPFRVKILPEGSEYTVAISSELAPLIMVDFYDFSLTNAPSVIVGGALPSFIGTDGFRMEGQTFLQGVGYSNSSLRQLVFKTTCNTSIDFSTDPIPQGLNYTSSGYNSIELKAIGNSGSHSIKSLPIVVSGNTAPDITFQVSGGICVSSDINFTSQNLSGGITDYDWNFGDSNSSTAQNPVHQYSSSNNFEAALQVTATNGCTNQVRKTVAIYNAPTANFNLPTASPICTNQNYNFTNTSMFDAASNPTWEWTVNGTPVSSSENLIHSITSATMQDVKLKVLIPGCESEITRTIVTVQDGPLTNFTFSNGCEDTSIVFTNTTSGPVTSYSWDFGNGNTSGQINSSNTFADFGKYDVTLQATNAAGCVNTSIQEVTIYSKPQPNFSIDLPPFSCSGSPSQFNDLTPNPVDSNLSGWSWSFNDSQNGSSIVRNPQYVYTAAGLFNVDLEVTTNFGCTATVQKPVNISQSPDADFNYSPACVNQGTTFTPLTPGNASSWQWKIGASTYNQQNPTHVFGLASTYNAELTANGINGCISVKSKSVIVPVALSVDFKSENNCANQGTLFTDKTSVGADLPMSRAWQFSTLGNGTGISPTFNFPSSGSYPVKLVVTTASGCSYSISKSISIVNSPVASFNATPQTGTPPLNVKLSNTSTNIVSQLWTVNDGNSSSSTEASPTFTFNTLGEYVVDLAVVNAEGCTTTTSKIISVIIPSLDVELNSLTLIPATNGETNLLISVTNKSNSSVTNLKALVDIGGGAVISENIDVVIQPGQNHTQLLSSSIVGKGSNLNYVCVEIVVDGDYDSSNNKRCVSNEDDLVIFEPYPNPGSDKLNISWIATASGDAELNMFDPSGRKVLENKFVNFAEGYNNATTSLTTLNPGIYYVLFVSANSRKSFRYVVRK